MTPMHQILAELENLRHDVRGHRFAALDVGAYENGYPDLLEAEQHLQQALAALEHLHAKEDKL